MFIGQTKILRELDYYIDAAKDGAAFNILLNARSGYGKTHLGISVVSNVATYQVILEQSAEAVLERIRKYNTRANLIDEVHLVQNIELLYPLMDSSRLFLVFATNMAVYLPEAFRRRCISLTFERYSKRELIQVARQRFDPSVDISMECCEEIVRASNYTPGNIVILCIRIQAVFRDRTRIDLEELKSVLVDVFNIQNGLDSRCREYLEVLRSIGGTSSLETISFILGISKETVKREIECVLLEKNLISITSKGRSLIC